jgi:hypothetical protein
MFESMNAYWVPLAVRSHLGPKQRKERQGPKASVNGGGSSKKRMVSFSNQIPKKFCKEAKHCALCKKHGGAQNTHNTGDCRKYE